MESVLKKIFSGKIDEEIHSEFIRFSRGVFNNRYLIEAKKQKDRLSIKTGHEFANFLIRKCLEKVKGDIELKGVIVYTGSLGESKLQIERVKQFIGVKQYVINTKTNASDVLDVMNKNPRAFYALSFSFPDGKLKIKAKAPKSAKPSNKGEADVKANFCYLKTADKNIVEDLFFDFPNFTEIKIKHTLKIEEVIVPKDIEDPVKMREMSKRKGKILREINIDGKLEKKEIEFEA